MLVHRMKIEVIQKEVRHSRELLAGIQGNRNWTPDQNIRG